jgi:hypothetical protein
MEHGEIQRNESRVGCEDPDRELGLASFNALGPEFGVWESDAHSIGDSGSNAHKNGICAGTDVEELLFIGGG